MKIWLDTTLLSQSSQERNDECADCDNDCADCWSAYDSRSRFVRYRGRSLYNSLPHFSSLHIEEDVKHISICHFQKSKYLYMKECDDGNWLVCNPVESGWIVVVDRQAIDLLKHFCTPTTLFEVNRVSDWSTINLERVINLFHQLEFLQDIDHLSTSQKIDGFQTLSAWLHVRNACNLRCHYCYIQKSSEHMADTTAQRAIDTIFHSAVKHRYQRVLLKYAGGEASLQLANVLAIHDYATRLAHLNELKLHAYIMSNGVALSQRVIDHLRVRSIGVMISLDGVGSSHDDQRSFMNGRGSFTYVDSTITRLLTSGLTPHINVIVAQRNLEGLPKLMEYLLKRDLPFTLSYYRFNEFSKHLHDLQFEEEQMITAMRLTFNVIEQCLPQRRLIGSLIDRANMTTIHQRACGVGQNYLVINHMEE